MCGELLEKRREGWGDRGVGETPEGDFVPQLTK